MGFNSDVRSSRATSSSATATATSPVVNALKHELATPIHLRVPTPEDQALLKQGACLRDFMTSYREVESYKLVSCRLSVTSYLNTLFYRNGSSIPLTGEALTISAVTAIARYPDLVANSIDNALAALNKDQARIDRLLLSRKVIDEKLAQNKSIYGVSTGFGGSGTSNWLSLSFATDVLNVINHSRHTYGEP